MNLMSIMANQQIYESANQRIGELANGVWQMGGPPVLPSAFSVLRFLSIPSPRAQRPRAGVGGAVKKRSVSASSTSLPPSIRPVRCASRLAWKTLWVTSTTVVPCSALSLRMISSIRPTLYGSRLAVGSSSSSTARPDHQRPRQRHTLHLAAGKAARGLVGELRQAHPFQDGVHLPIGSACPRKLQTIGHVASTLARRSTGRWKTVVTWRRRSRGAVPSVTRWSMKGCCRGRRLEEVEQAQQRRLARRRWAPPTPGSRPARTSSWSMLEHGAASVGLAEGVELVDHDLNAE